MRLEGDGCGGADAEKEERPFFVASQGFKQEGVGAEEQSRQDEVALSELGGTILSVKQGEKRRRKKAI